MTSLHYDAQDAPPELYQSDRIGVLFFLILHANIRSRCWPSLARIMLKTKISKPTIIKAIRWLEGHKAIEVVPFKLRVGEEKDLPPRLNVYQLTGVIEWNGETIPYLYVGKTPSEKDDTQSKASLLMMVKPVDGKASLPKLESEDNSTESEGTNNISAASKAAPNIDKFPVTDEVKNAFAIVCYGTKDAWDINAAIMGKALKALSKYEKRSLTLDDLRDFRQWWKKHDWRGKQMQLPEPHTVTSVWARFKAGAESTLDTALTEQPSQPKRIIRRIKKGESNGV